MQVIDLPLLHALFSNHIVRSQGVLSRSLIDN